MVVGEWRMALPTVVDVLRRAVMMMMLRQLLEVAKKWTRGDGARLAIASTG